MNVQVTVRYYVMSVWEKGTAVFLSTILSVVCSFMIAFDEFLGGKKDLYPRGNLICGMPQTQWATLDWFLNIVKSEEVECMYVVRLYIAWFIRKTKYTY